VVQRGVVASLLPIPIQVFPPVLLAVHDGAAIKAVRGDWEVLEVPTSPHPDGLEVRSKDLDLTYLM
jgi:hypothetical protein